MSPGQKSEMKASIQYMETYATFMLAWFALFSCINCLRISRRILKGAPVAKDSAGFTELAGLPLTAIQPICFAKAASAGSLAGMAFFLWWGPGFVLTIFAVLIARILKKRIDWKPLSQPISWACKLYYLAYIAAFFAYGVPILVFVFSVWIINDQIEKLFMSLDADRTRRTFDDKWIVRICYPLGLLVPLFSAEMPYRAVMSVYGLVLLLVWLMGLRFVYRQGKFFALPEDPSLLRNMIYFGLLRVT